MLCHLRPAILALSALVLAPACTQNAQPVTLRSLEANGRFSFLCLGTRDPADTDPLWEPRDLEDCPDQSLTDGEARRAFAMVTQTSRGEVALVDLTVGQVVDGEPTVPGFNFFPIGANPTGIVSTPGSMATFVGVAEVGKEGIFALPASCTTGRRGDAPLRDLTTWSACRLPSAPGEMAMIIDEPDDPAQPNVYRQKCGEAAREVEPQSTRECPADLSTETTRPGRRKLVVALPALGEIDVIDAQSLLNRPPGEFQACVVEQHLPLAAEPHQDWIPPGGIKQVEPPDLIAISPTVPGGLGHPTPGPAVSQPAGFAQVDDATTHEQTLYVADDGVAMIHVIDTRDACKLKEEPALFPASFMDPARLVTTRKLAASPLTIPPSGSSAKRYLYAIDEIDNGSVMFFDITQGVDLTDGWPNPTPLLRPRSGFSTEAPDRIGFDSPAQDVTFALRDPHPIPDPMTGVQTIGVECDPNPNLPMGSAAAGYRPVADLTMGAAPSILRGLFGFVALSSGHVAVIDVQDFDAPCRRPISSNPSPTEDFRGCSNDPLPARDRPASQQFVIPPADTPTVTDEVTCQAVEQHRARTATVIRNDTSIGIHAPSLRAFPTLVSDQGRSLPQNHTDGRDNPRMLAADFSRQPVQKAQVWVGTTLYAPGDATSPLVTDPATADQASLSVSFQEPRIYLPQENFSATYEGVIAPARQSARLVYPDATESDGLSLSDGAAGFCGHGVEDQSLARLRAQRYGLTDPPCPAQPGQPCPVTDAQKFASLHADYARITSDLLPDDDDYWRGHGASCGESNPAEAGAGLRFCQRQYGTSINPTPFRDFRIVKAETERLVLEPRNVSGTKASGLEKERLTCCFPQIVSYVVRASKEWVVIGSASGFPNNITNGTAPPGAPPAQAVCTTATDPLHINLNSRVINISCATNDCALDDTGKPTIGQVDDGEVACVVGRNGATLSSLTDPDTSGCVFKGLPGNFVVYRGNLDAVTGFEFDWTLMGGFSPLLINLAATDSNTSPQSMVFSPARDGLVIADGSAQGLVVVDLSTFAATIAQ